MGLGRTPPEGSKQDDLRWPGLRPWRAREALRVGLSWLWRGRASHLLRVCRVPARRVWTLRDHSDDSASAPPEGLL